MQQLNDLPIKTVGDATIYLRDVATISDGFAPQTNVVRQDGRRGVLVSILKAGTASTIDVVNGIRGMLSRVEQTLPPQLHIQPLADQSVFVKAAVSGVIREAVIAACLTALMILLFLGSWRSTIIIATSIQLSILTSVMALSFLGQTINIMTLGGLALAVDILVDDVYAPFDGDVTARNTDVGDRINAGAGTPTTELFHMAATKTLRIYVAVPEIDAPSMQAGATPTVTLDEYPGQVFTAALSATALRSIPRRVHCWSRSTSTTLKVNCCLGPMCSSISCCPGTRSP